MPAAAVAFAAVAHPELAREVERLRAGPVPAEFEEAA